MKKRLLLVMLTFVAFAVVSCNREEPTPDNPSNSGEFDTYQKIEAYCLENGWSECSLNSYDYFYQSEDFFGIHYEGNGTLGLGDPYRFKFYSSFNSLLSVNTPPTEGYVHYFTCDDQKFGICNLYEHEGYGGYTPGYSMFYIRRVNNNTIKILYKKCDWSF